LQLDLALLRALAGLLAAPVVLVPALAPESVLGVLIP
jgi:hypothetical protein